MSDIQRHFARVFDETELEEVVIYSDHLKTIEAKDLEIKGLKKNLKESKGMNDYYREVCGLKNGDEKDLEIQEYRDWIGDYYNNSTNMNEHYKKGKALLSTPINPSIDKDIDNSEPIIIEDK